MPEVNVPMRLWLQITAVCGSYLVVGLAAWRLSSDDSALPDVGRRLVGSATATFLPLTLGAMFWIAFVSLDVEYAPTLASAVTTAAPLALVAPPLLAAVWHYRAGD